MDEKMPGPGFAGRVVLLTVLAVLLIEGLHQLVYHRSTLDPLLELLRGRAMDDSWRPMRVAYAAWRAPREAALYQVVFFQERVKFQYPLSSLLPLHFADLLGLTLGKGRLNKIGLLSVLLQAAAVGQITYLAFKSRASAPLGRPALAGVWTTGALLTLCFYPVLSAYRLGQVQAWINAWFSLACLAWMYGRPGWAGLLIGLICLFKPQFALFLPWALLRRQWRFVVGWGVVALGGTALSLRIFGLHDNLDYFSVLSFIGHHGEAFYPNQSVNGLLNRLLGNGNNLEWDDHGFPPYNAFVYGATLVSSAALSLGAMLYRWRGRAFGVVDLMIAALSFTIASPVAWEHHYGILVVAFPVLAALILEHEQGAARRRLLVGLAVCWVLCALLWTSANDLAGYGWVNVGQSYLLMAGVGVLEMLYRLGVHAVEKPGAGEVIDPSSRNKRSARPGSYA